MASATGHFHFRPQYQPLTESQKIERANRRATVALFAGLVVLATIATTVSVIANAVIAHPRGADSVGNESGVAAVPAMVSLFVAPPGRRVPKANSTTRTRRPISTCAWASLCN